MRRSGLLLGLQPWPIYIAREGKISFAGDMKWKWIDTTRIQGTDNRKVTDSDLSVPQVMKHHGTDTKNLHGPEVNPPRLLLD